jgi:hypothetical protein
MLELSKCLRFIDEGFSIITVSSDKKPNFTWKEYQSEKQISKEQFTKQYNYRGGYIKKDGFEMKSTENIGLCTGYDFLECIDVDLKVFSTAKEKKDFWNDYLSFLEDNILDFHDKFVIRKTKSDGYHILYKTKRVEGNQKLSKLKGHKEAVIETRGRGGYVFLYPENDRNFNSRNYFDIDFITDDDREILFEISKSYDYIEPQREIIPKELAKNYEKSKNTPWDDYNNKTSIFDIISDDFIIVRQDSKKFHIKRHGATSTHSGYVFKDTGGMYLFSTGTIYNSEEYYTPFKAFACKYFNNDYSEASRDLYKKGFGDRVKIKPVFELEKIEIKKEYLDFPIDIFEKPIQDYIMQCAVTLNNSIDYMGCSLLFVASVVIGNSIKIEVKNGWQEPANLWLSLVGKAGVGKTPSINSITFPIEKVNQREIKKYIKDFKKYEAYQSLDQNEKKLTEKIEKPKKTQFIVDDITLESLADVHNENPNGIGIKKDEQAGWLKDMNKYRQGSDKEQWLSSWSNGAININRKTAKSSFVPRAFMPVIGGIQPAILDQFYTEENKDSGFLDRMLFCFPDLEPKKYSENEIPFNVLEWYENYIIGFYENIKLVIQRNIEGEIEPHKARFTKEAKKEWIRIHDKIIEMQLSDSENEYMKSMLPKQISYIPRFALILNTLSSIENESVLLNEITKESLLKAERLSNYFINMAKKIKTKSTERSLLKKAIRESKKKDKYEQFCEIYHKDISKIELAEALEVSRQMIYKYVKKFETN